MEEITAYVKGAICDDQCLGRCLYIHGVPGTGKVKHHCSEIIHLFINLLSIELDLYNSFSSCTHFILNWTCFMCFKLQTMSVLSVMRSLRSEVEAGNIKPYCFVEINGLKLSSPENIYKVCLKYNLTFLAIT